MNRLTTQFSWWEQTNLVLLGGFHSNLQAQEWCLVIRGRLDQSDVFRIGFQTCQCWSIHTLKKCMHIPLVHKHNPGKSQLLMAKWTINGNFQWLCWFTSIGEMLDAGEYDKWARLQALGLGAQIPHSPMVNGPWNSLFGKRQIEKLQTWKL